MIVKEKTLRGGSAQPGPAPILAGRSAVPAAASGSCRRGCPGAAGRRSEIARGVPEAASAGRLLDPWISRW